jgi:dihydrofolate reductase
MRQVIFGGANSLDNFFARPDGAVDWLQWSDEAAAIMAETWRTVDTTIMGRKTFEVARRMGPGPSELGGLKSYVFSRTLPDEPGVNIVREDVTAFVRRLKGESGKDIVVLGGGELARPLFEAGLIDRLGLNIHPVLLGSGVPVFHGMSRDIRLELEECRPFKNGCVCLTYRVKHENPSEQPRPGGSRRERASRAKPAQR